MFFKKNSSSVQPVTTFEQAKPTSLQEISEAYEKKNKKKKIIIITTAIITVLILLAVCFLYVLKPSNQESADVIQSRELMAKFSKVRSNAKLIENMVGAYQTSKGQYPNNLNTFTTNGKMKFPNGITLIDSSKDKLSDDNGQTAIWYQYSDGSSQGSGARIQYWDYKTHNISREVVYLGDATKDSVFSDMK